jgi:hypothetical protein
MFKAHPGAEYCVYRTPNVDALFQAKNALVYAGGGSPQYESPTNPCQHADGCSRRKSRPEISLSHVLSLCLISFDWNRERKERLPLSEIARIATMTRINRIEQITSFLRRLLRF